MFLSDFTLSSIWPVYCSPIVLIDTQSFDQQETMHVRIEKWSTFNDESLMIKMNKKIHFFANKKKCMLSICLIDFDAIIDHAMLFDSLSIGEYQLLFKISMLWFIVCYLLNLIYKQSLKQVACLKATLFLKLSEGCNCLILLCDVC